MKNAANHSLKQSFSALHVKQMIKGRRSYIYLKHIWC